ncbi:MAG TPA: D-alanine--D-alanine ligase [Puia sp.]|jgi:D-alanine-D-alanine ligase|nr:D-alanine--D-alanine ligase [Puia sp.]
MKKVIAFVTGGYSSEAEVSYKSAITMEAEVDKSIYEVYRIDITPSEWFHPGKNGKKIQVDKNDFSLQIDGKKIVFDAVLIGIHGTPGEDGKLQGYFDLMNLPYTTCNAATSAITFNKRYTVAVAAFAGISVSNSIHLFKQDNPVAAELAGRITLPVFVKPNNGGSSIGMSKVNRQEDLDAALKKAFKEDNEVLVEEFISGREFTVGVFRTIDEIIVLPITEVKTNKDFFDFEAKYSPGFSEETTPADLDDAIAEKVRYTARKIYQVFNCNGVVRIDMIYNEAKGEPYMLEINTVPGQTAASVVPQQVRAKGWTLKQFYSALIEDALSRADKS